MSEPAWKSTSPADAKQGGGPDGHGPGPAPESSPRRQIARRPRARGCLPRPIFLANVLRCLA